MYDKRENSNRENSNRENSRPPRPPRPSQPSSPRVISSGFVVRSKDGKFLLGKTTKYPKDQCWTVFKGQQERGESLMATAVRELREESGIDILRSMDLQLSHSTSPFFDFSMKGKDVILYLLNDTKGVLDNATFKCASYWGPNKNPEISEYKWCDLEEMESLVFPSQRGLVAYLRDVEFSS